MYLFIRCHSFRETLIVEAIVKDRSGINSGVIIKVKIILIDKIYMCFAVRTDSITCGQFYGVYEYRDIPTAA